MTVYTNTARFDTGRPMTEDEMFKVAPSIFAVEAHESRSERFKPIPTIEVLRGLAKEGFHAVGAVQGTTRDPGKRAYTKHLIRLRRFDGQTYNVGDNVVECLLKNANDGTAAYDLMAGMFRIRCLNSLVAQTSTIDSVKVRHSGDVGAKVIEGTFRVLGEAENLLTAPQDWSRIQLAAPEREAFAEAARVIRFGDDETGEVKTPITARHLLTPRRFDDRADDLWTTFNVVQEHVIRGGDTAMGRDANLRRRRSTSRAVNGIDQSVKLNKALWVLAESMAKLKAA